MKKISTLGLPILFLLLIRFILPTTENRGNGDAGRDSSMDDRSTAQYGAGVDQQKIGSIGHTTLGKDGLLYSIEELQSGGYSYEIRTFEGDIISQGTTEIVDPRISDLCSDSRDGVDHHILRLELSQGSNNLLVQYFNAATGASSFQYEIPSLFDDFCDGSETLLAFFDMRKEGAILAVYDVFSGETIAEIKRGFVSALMPGRKLRFLNRYELYVDYDLIEGAPVPEYIYEGKGSVKQVREIIAFRS